MSPIQPENAAAVGPVPVVPAESMVPPVQDNTPVPQHRSSKPLKLLLLLAIPVILILAGGAWMLFANNKTEQEVAQVVETPQISPTPLPLTLSITNPAEGDVVNDSKVKVSGTTLPKTAVVVYTDTDSNSVDSNTDGSFEVELTLAEGLNTITGTAVAPSGEELTATLNIVYEAQVKGVSSDKKTAGASTKASVGSVKDVKNNSVTIANDKTNKQTQVAIDNSTQIVDENKKRLKVNSIKLDTQVAIVASDSAATATGSANKKATKIYVKSVKESKRSAVSGVITDISGDTVTISHLVQRDRITPLVTTSNTVVKMKDVPTATLTNLIIGMRIAAVGDRDADGNLVVVRIHVIPGAATGAFKNPFPTNSPALTSTPSATATTTPTGIASPSGTVTTTLTPTAILTPTP